MKLHKIAFILLIIGGLNWGLTVFGYGIQNWLSAGVSQIVFILVAISAIIEIVGHKKNCRACMMKGGM